MAREIRSQVQLLAANSPIPVSDFKDRLVKLIPSEIVTAYVTLYGLIGDSKVSGKKDILLWIVVGILFFKRQKIGADNFYDCRICYLGSGDRKSFSAHFGFSCHFRWIHSFDIIHPLHPIYIQRIKHRFAENGTTE